MVLHLSFGTAVAAKQFDTIIIHPSSCSTTMNFDLIWFVNFSQVQLWFQLCCSGSYCIFKRGDCPSDFSAGSIYWDDAAPFITRTSQTYSGVYLVLSVFYLFILFIIKSYTHYKTDRMDRAI